jgi:HrpA-like RNA helicase
MSSLPTLMRKGYIVPNAKLSAAEKERINNMVSIEYILNFISDRIPVQKGVAPKKPPTKLGDKVIVLKSDTGSGKSTVLPPELYKMFMERTRKNIAITQPRVLTAMDIPVGLPRYHPSLKMDINVGYNTGTYKRLPSDKGLIFMTPGIILQQLIIMEDEDFLKKYQFILVDEVHERSIEIDSLLYMLKKLLENNWKNTDCPMIILMSATFRPDLFMNYYGCPSENFIQVVGKTFPIEENYAPYDVPDYSLYAIDKAEELHINNIADLVDDNEFRDILIFVQTEPQVKKIIKALHVFNSNVLDKPFDEAKAYLENKKRNKTGGAPDASDPRYYIAPISLTGKSFYKNGVEYQNLFSNIDDISMPIYKSISATAVDEKSIVKWVKPSRRIIVATNIAETGVTIETLKYCIDTGYVFGVSFNPEYGATLLINKNITKSMAIQRRGRVGRKSPGNWYACYTKETFNALIDDQFSAILLDDITGTILNIIFKETESSIVDVKDMSMIADIKKRDDNGLFQINYISNPEWVALSNIKKLNFSAVDLLEIPSSQALVYAFEKLYGLGLIDSQYKPTSLGYYANKIRKLPIESVRMILAGYSYGANILDLITIAAFLSVRRHDIFARKYKPINPFDKAVSESDFEFYNKIVIADEFIECVYVWELFSEFINTYIDTIHKKVKKGSPYEFSVNALEAWCDDRKIVYDKLIQVVAVRDELIENLIAIGLNPYYNGLGIEQGKYNLLNITRSGLSDGIAEIKKLKQCILDGYRFNLATWDQSTFSYILCHRKIPVSVRDSNIIGRMGDDAKQRGPLFIVVDSISAFEKMDKSGLYEFSSKTVSVMDGYIDVDTEFLNH